MKKIIADPNIPLLDNFEFIGNVVRIPGRKWTNDLVHDADILLTRSVTKVDVKLLNNSRVQFVGTATSGFDHVDTGYLEQQGIHFSYCPGSNANSVAEYILSALFAVVKPERTFKGMTAGIVGCGHVGSHVVEKLKAVGIECILHDPPLKDKTGDGKYRSLKEALSADIVTLHTPLTSAGKYPTRDLITDQQFQQMKPGVIFINAARGGVVDEAALLKRMENCPEMKTVIDCWENEPAVNHELLGASTLATPHIAGYSYDGKVKATKMLYKSLCDFLELESEWSDPDGADKNNKQFDYGKDDLSLLRELVFSCYDVRIDDQEMKKLISLSAGEAKIAFDRLRKDYRIRNEFDKTSVQLTENHAVLRALGFQIKSTSDNHKK